MRRIVLLIVWILLFNTVFSVSTSLAQEYNVEELWTNPMDVNDIAVSGDGKYIAVVNDTGLYYFTTGSGNPLWWYTCRSGENYLSVAISSEGEHVIVGNNTISEQREGALFYFANCRNRAGGPSASNNFTWSSISFWDRADNGVDRRTIDISQDGEYVVVGGTGENVYYFENCTLKSGTEVDSDWKEWVSANVLALDMTPDGRYIAVGGGPSPPFTAFFDAMAEPPHKKWENHDLAHTIVDIAISDDGYSVSAVSQQASTLHYWSNASNLTTSPDANWTRNVGFACVDMSSDGEKVVTGTGTAILPCGIHYWDGARGLENGDPPEDWTRHSGEYIPDIAISEDGNIIVAVAERYTGHQWWTYIHTSDGDSLGEFEIDFSDIISMSNNGGVVAVGSSSSRETLRVYRIAISLEEPEPVGGIILNPNVTNILHLIILALTIILIGSRTGKTWFKS